MDLYRVGEALIRSSQPLLPFLAPSAYRLAHATRAAPIARHCRPSRSQCEAPRSFTTSQCQRQQGSAAERVQEDDDFPAPSQAVPSTIPRSSTDEIGSILDDALDFKKSSPASASSRTSRFSSRRAQANNPFSRGRANDLGASSTKPGTDPIDDIFSGLGSRAGGSREALDAASAFSSINGTQSRREPPEETAPPMKLGPSLGRTIRVNTERGIDAARAFRMLEMECARNSVRKDSMRQRFHERPGLKRKRLKSERWRKNFKTNFKGVVAMVQNMRKQGW